MTLHSFAARRGDVTFPEFTGERVYMREFHAADRLPADLARWTPTVEAMLDGVDTDGPIYLMIDQSVVAPGSAQRRPGAHIDGYWHPGFGHRGGRHFVSAHRPTPGRHSALSPVSPALSPTAGYGPAPGYRAVSPSAHRPTPGRHTPTIAPVDGAAVLSWETAHLQPCWAPEGLLLASDVTASRALVGDWDGPIGDGGDCTHADLHLLNPVVLERDAVWAGNVTMVHESLPLPAGGPRTLVRLNVPGWTPEAAAA